MQVTPRAPEMHQFDYFAMITSAKIQNVFQIRSTRRLKFMKMSERRKLPVAEYLVWSLLGFYRHWARERIEGFSYADRLRYSCHGILCLPFPCPPCNDRSAKWKLRSYSKRESRKRMRCRSSLVLSIESIWRMNEWWWNGALWHVMMLQFLAN